ncbi:MAG: VOC family protein [Chloroflexi bacterium]|nr:VOC family protein [Chloroflexota bacterium]
MFKFYRIHLKTVDVVATARWYEERLSARRVEEYRRDGNHHILVDVDGIEIIITQPPNAASLPVAPAEPHIGLEHIGLTTGDLEGLLTDMEAHGVEIIERAPPDREGEYAFVRAPDGVRLELVQG